MWFSPFPINDTTCGEIPAIPQINELNIILDDRNWTRVSGTFTATNSARFLLLGNFDINANTQAVPVGGNFTNARYYVDDVTVIELVPGINVFGNTTICYGESTVLNAVGDTLYQWAETANPTVIIGTGPSLQVSPLVTTSYNVYGLNDTSTVTVNVIPLPVINLGNDTIVCPGSPVMLDAFIFGSTYLWQDGFTGPLYAASQPGTYSVIVTNIYGCVGTDIIQISNYGLPSTNLGNDTTLCAGDSLTLNAFYPGATYLWHDGSNGPTYLASSSGSYSVTVTDINGCRSNDYILISNFPLPGVNLGNDTSLCQGDQIAWNVLQPGATYLWHDGSVQPTNQSTTGLNWVEVTNSLGCTGIDSIMISRYPNPAVNLGNDTVLCPGEILVLDASIINGSYLWNNGSILPQRTLSATGSYWIEVTDNNGCSARDTININYVSSTAISLGNDTIVCEGSNLLLDVSLAGAAYMWQDGSNMPTYSVTQSGLYYVEVTLNGCTAFDTILISFDPTPSVNLGNDTTLCDGETIILDALQANATYIWQDASTNPFFQPTISGVYQVTVTLGICSSSDAIDITFNPLPVIDLGPDASYCDDETATLTVQGNYSFIWQDGSTGSSYQVNSPGVYSVTASNGNCSSNDSVDISFKNCNCQL